MQRDYFVCTARNGQWECWRKYCGRTHRELGVVQFNFVTGEMKAVASLSAVGEFLKIVAMGIAGAMLIKAWKAA